MPDPQQSAMDAAREWLSDRWFSPVWCEMLADLLTRRERLARIAALKWARLTYYDQGDPAAVVGEKIAKLEAEDAAGS